MEVLKVTLALCVSALPTEAQMDSQVKQFRESYPHSKVTVTYQTCENSGKSVKILKGKKVVYTQ